MTIVAYGLGISPGSGGGGGSAYAVDTFEVAHDDGLTVTIAPDPVLVVTIEDLEINLTEDELEAGNVGDHLDAIQR